MDQSHVVIVGGGFAGLGCAQKLGGNDRVRVTLIDRNNYHQFQPLLYQVATSQLAPSDIAHSLRAVFVGEDNVDVKLADIAEVDPATRTVTATDGQQWSGDVLVLAAGSQPNFFNTPGAAENVASAIAFGSGAGRFVVGYGHGALAGAAIAATLALVSLVAIPTTKMASGPQLAMH